MINVMVCDLQSQIIRNLMKWQNGAKPNTFKNYFSIKVYEKIDPCTRTLVLICAVLSMHVD